MPICHSILAYFPQLFQVKHGASCTKMEIYNSELIYNDRDLFVYFPSILSLYPAIPIDIIMRMDLQSRWGE